MPKTEREIATAERLLPGLFVVLASYRIKMPVREVMVFKNGDGYYICPRCDITLDREFVAYCDRCGQRLGWKGYRKAKVVHPGRKRKNG